MLTVEQGVPVGVPVDVADTATVPEASTVIVALVRALNEFVGVSVSMLVREGLVVPLAVALAPSEGLPCAVVLEEAEATIDTELIAELLGVSVAPTRVAVPAGPEAEGLPVPLLVAPMPGLAVPEGVAVKQALGLPVVKPLWLCIALRVGEPLPELPPTSEGELLREKEELAEPPAMLGVGSGGDGDTDIEAVKEALPVALTVALTVVSPSGERVGAPTVAVPRAEPEAPARPLAVGAATLEVGLLETIAVGVAQAELVPVPMGERVAETESVTVPETDGVEDTEGEALKPNDPVCEAEGHGDTLSEGEEEKVPPTEAVALTLSVTEVQALEVQVPAARGGEGELETLSARSGEGELGADGEALMEGEAE